MRTPVLVVADDFGLSAGVNKGVVAAFEAGMLSGASLIVNMPGFEEACRLARRHGLQDKIGLHVNLAEGTPLTEPIRSHAKFCRDGVFAWPRRPCFSLTNREREAVAVECEAQYRRYREAGMRPLRLDSHRHIHKHWPVATILLRLSRPWGVPSVRLSVNAGARPWWHPNRLYATAFNARLRLRRMADTRYFGDIDDVRSLLGKTARRVEIMVHPYMDRRRRLHNLFGAQRRSLRADLDAVKDQVVVLPDLEQGRRRRGPPLWRRCELPRFRR